MSYEINKSEINGAQMNYIKFGTGNTPLVILPGLSVQSLLPLAEAIEKQYEIFESDFTVYLFERRANLPPSYSVYDMAEDTAAAIGGLGLKDVCLFGASQGGMIGIALASEHPESVKRLAVSSAALRITDKSGAVINEWLSLAENEEKEKLNLSFGEKIFPKKLFEEYKSFLTESAQLISEDDLKRFIILAKGMNGLDLTEKIKKISCPVLALGDTDDGVFGADYIKEYEEQMKGNALFYSYTYNGFGHAVYDTAPDFQKRLYDFFTKA